MTAVDLTPLLYALIKPAISPVPYYEVPPEGAAFPYVQIGRVIGRNRDLHDATRTAWMIYLDIWSDSASQAEIIKISGQIFDAVHRFRGPLRDLDGQPTGASAEIIVRDRIVTPEPDGKTYKGLVGLSVTTSGA